MAEMTPERRAAWQAEEDRKAEARRRKRRDATRAKTAADTEAHAGDLEVFESREDSLRPLWLTAFLGPANYNGVKAAEIAGYAQSSWWHVANKNKQVYAKQIAAHFESTYLQKSEVVATLVNTWRGPGEYLDFDDGTFNIGQTIENLKAAGLMGLVVGVKETKDGTQLLFRDPDQALGRIIQMTGLNAPIKIDLSSVPRADLESEGDIYLRELAAMALIDGAIDADYVNDTAEADESAD
jgi:hypothetical protein